MCKVNSAVLPNPYINNSTKNSVQNKVNNSKSVKTNEPVNSVKDNQSIPHKNNIETKSSKNNVAHKINIDDDKEVKDIYENVSTNISSSIGTTQTVMDLAKKAAVIGEGTTVLAKTATVARTLTSLSVVKSVDKIASSPIANKALGVFSIVSGGFQAARGIKDIKNGKTERGTFNVLGGASNVVMGGALLVGAAPVAVAAGFVGLGVGVVKYGSSSVKQLGWLKGKDGKAQTAFERLSERANDVQKAVERKTGSKVLGYTAKVASGVAMVPAAIATSVGGAVVSGGKAIGSAVSNAWNYFFK